MGGAFARQGSRVLVVRGMDGMDEISVCTPTEVVTVDAAGRTGEEVINPRSVGLDFHEDGSLAGGDASYNADVAVRLMKGEITGAIKDAVLINAAGALTAVRGWEEKGFQASLSEQVEHAREALESGAAWKQMEKIVGRKF